MPIIPWVGDLIRRTPGTISLGQGVVDYAPPAAAHEALIRFGSEPARHKYQHELGIPELRERIAARLTAENGIDVDRFSLMVTAGGNMAFLTALLAICDQGDEVVLVKPYFFNHEMAVRIIGGRPVVVAADERYQLDSRCDRGSHRTAHPRRGHHLAQQSERGGVSGIRSARGERTVRGPGLVPHQRRGL